MTTPPSASRICDPSAHTATRAEGDAEPIKVLYLAGLGRSGSTLLQLLLARVPGTVAAGEVTHLWERGLLEGQRCGCGTPLPRCDFWQDVLSDAGLDASEPSQLRRLQESVDRERHLLWLDRPWASERSRRDAAAYRDVLARLYRAVARRSAASVVVDTSKHPATAAVLAGTPGIELHVVHLVRDPRAVAYSWTRHVARPEVTSQHELMPRWNPPTTAGWWMRENVLVESLARRGANVTRVAYEALVANPVPVLHDICRDLDLRVPFDLASELGLGEVTPARTHTVAGNPMRFRDGPVRLRVDDEWRTRMAAADRRTVTALTAPLSWRYGYRDATPPQAPSASGDAPSVTVVIPTRDRLALAHEAVAAALAQRYPGQIECLLVFDQSPRATELEIELRHRRVRTVSNQRTPGLAGARNTGILAATGDLVAFCDDDDWWNADKLARQVERLRDVPDARVVATSTVIHHAGREHVRRWAHDTVTKDDFLRSRVQEVHPSSLLIRRDAFDEVGLVDETIPGSYGEDHDWLIRASSHHPVEMVQDPLVHARWHTASFFADRHKTIIEAMDYLVAKHPALASDGVGRRRLAARKAFSDAALGHRRSARSQAAAVLRRDPFEPRAAAALAVGTGLVSATTLQQWAHRVGRGI